MTNFYFGTKQSNPDWLVRFWDKSYDEVKTKIGKLKKIQDFFIIIFIKGYWNSKHRLFCESFKKGEFIFWRQNRANEIPLWILGNFKKTIPSCL